MSHFLRLGALKSPVKSMSDKEGAVDEGAWNLIIAAAQGPFSVLPLLSPKGLGGPADASFDTQAAASAGVLSFGCTAPCLLPAYSEASAHSPDSRPLCRCLYD